MRSSRRETIRQFFLEPFRTKLGINKPLLILFLLINAIILRNAVFHDPAIGYDAFGYYDYIRVLAQGRLPISAETPEFFSPPLPFMPAAAVYSALTQGDTPALNPPNAGYPLIDWFYYRFFFTLDDFPLALVGKMTQLLNVLYSLIVTFLLLKICSLLKPNDHRFKLFSLALLGMMTVYYRLYAFVRAEPLMLAVIMASFYSLFWFWKQKRFDMALGVILGILAGLGMLTRQWFFSTLVTLSLALLIMAWQFKIDWRRSMKVIFAFALIIGVIAGPFYLHLQTNEGTVAAFNQPFIGIALQSDWTYYLELGLDRVFTDPIRSTLTVRAIPMLYSDTWGDYWAYFTVWGRDTRTNRFVYGVYLDNSRLAPEDLADPNSHLESNRFEINEYLARVNIVSLLPSAILLGGLVAAVPATLSLFRRKKATFEDNAVGIFTIFLVFSLTIYLLFLIFFTYDTPGTIKAGYLLHIYPILALFGGRFLADLEPRLGRWFVFLIVLLILVAIHNFPALLSNQVLWP